MFSAFRHVSNLFMQCEFCPSSAIVPPAPAGRPDNGSGSCASKRYWATRAGTGLLAMLLFTAGGASAQPLPARAATAESSPTADIRLASHRAVYDVTLVRASQNDSVRAAKGVMTYVVTDRCDGYTIESDLHLELAQSSGEDSDMDQRYAAWEAKDNRSASFRMLVLEDGAIKESYHGTATLDAQGAGSATYITDKPTTYALPAGTLLSTNHFIALIAAGLKDERFVSKPVFDGSFDDGPYRITAVVSPHVEHTVSAAGPAIGPAWPVSLAYFRLDSQDAAPDYELTMELARNGVVPRMMQDFGGFTLAFELRHFEPVTPAPC
jgi:hypothetical protein